MSFFKFSLICEPFYTYRWFSIVFRFFFKDLKPVGSLPSNSKISIYSWINVSQAIHHNKPLSKLIHKWWESLCSLVWFIKQRYSLYQEQP